MPNKKLLLAAKKMASGHHQIDGCCDAIAYAKARDYEQRFRQYFALVMPAAGGLVRSLTPLVAVGAIRRAVFERRKKTDSFRKVRWLKFVNIARMRSCSLLMLSERNK